MDIVPRKNEEPVSDAKKGRDSRMALNHCSLSSWNQFVHRMSLGALCLSPTVIPRNRVSHSNVPRYTSGKDPIPVSFGYPRKGSQLSTKRKILLQTPGTGVR